MLSNPDLWPLVFQIHFVSEPSQYDHIFAFTVIPRERYPLTSQLIEENSIPEFGAPISCSLFILPR